MKNNLKYSIALLKDTNQIIEAKNAENGKNCNCICPFCKNDMIAYNQGEVQRAHFRHGFSADCSASYESYIHWVTKAVFKEMNIINLPHLEYNSVCIDLRRAVVQFCDKQKFLPFINQRVKEKVLNDINEKFYNIKIKNVLTEHTFKNNDDSIRVDVVLEFGKQKLLIEPFFKNSINRDKMKILNELGFSVISIDLNKFLSEFGSFFTLDQLKMFLIYDLDSKEWKNHKLSKASIDNIIYSLEEQIEELNEPMLETESLNLKIDELSKEIEELYELYNQKIILKKSLIDKLNKILNL